MTLALYNPHTNSFNYGTSANPRGATPSRAAAPPPWSGVPGTINPADASADPVGTMARITRQEFATKTQTFDPFVDEILQFVNDSGAPVRASTQASELARSAVAGASGIEQRDAARYGLDARPVEARRSRDLALDATLASAAAGNNALFSTRDLQDQLGLEMLGVGRGVQTNAFGTLGSAAAGAQASEANRVAQASAKQSASQAKVQGALSSAASLGGLAASGALSSIGLAGGLSSGLIGGGAGLLLGLI